MIINSKRIRAVIFDLDGTIIDNADHHYSAWKLFTKKHNLPLDKHQYQTKFSGRNNAEILREIYDVNSLEKINTLAAEKEKIYRDNYAGNMQEIKGLTPLLLRLQKKNIQLAVATSAPRENKVWTLYHLNISHHFSITLDDEDTDMPKPNPEIYNKTMDRLGARPSEALVFEDSPAGITAAKKAKVSIVVALLTSHTAADLSEADACISDFTEVIVT